MFRRSWLVTAVVEIAPEPLFAALVADITDEARKLSALGGLSYDDCVHVDQTARSVTLRGHWWYRGVTSVRPHPRGSTVVYQVDNIAPPSTRWLAQIQHSFGYSATMRRDLAARLRRACGDQAFTVG